MSGPTTPIAPSNLHVLSFPQPCWHRKVPIRSRGLRQACCAGSLCITHWTAPRQVFFRGPESCEGQTPRWRAGAFSIISRLGSIFFPNYISMDNGDIVHVCRYFVVRFVAVEDWSQNIMRYTYENGSWCQMSYNCRWVFGLGLPKITYKV